METTTDAGQHEAARGETTRPHRSGVSVRVRITGAVALLVALALAGAGAIVYLIESERIEQQIAIEVDQEFQELALLESGGVNPETGLPFTDVGSLLETFLDRNVPLENETLVAWYDDRAQAGFPSGDVARATGFEAAVRPIVESNGSVRQELDGREMWLSAQSLQLEGSSDVGALIVVTDLDAARAGLLDTMRTYSIVSILALLIVTGFAGWQSGRLLAPLRTLRETAEEISDTDLSRRLPVAGNDDITALTLTVNRMLERLESAFVGQRQFLDDAGHELKTPLTVLRGHLELLDEGSPAEVEETKALLLDEVDRMARLVGDLILLAKSDRPDFVRVHPVDLTELTVDVLAKARGLGDRTWTLDETAQVTLPLDEQRMTQALLQLCDNAVKHTDPRQVVALGSSYDGVSARLWVRDSGAGVAPEARAHIFERFGRGVSRPGDEGFGLGLSIVSAIGGAHGGTVTVEDAEPSGARFVITIPATPTHVDPVHQYLDSDEELPIWLGS